MPTTDPSPLALRLSAEARRKVERLAAREGLSPEEAVERAVEQALGPAPAPFPPGTPFHGLEDLFDGLGVGPADLSTNRAYLDDLGAEPEPEPGA